jgi:hypothetical protein
METKELLKQELKGLDTNDLKDLIKKAMHDLECSNLIFVFGLDVLEERLNQDEYNSFCESL